MIYWQKRQTLLLWTYGSCQTSTKQYLYINRGQWHSIISKIYSFLVYSLLLSQSPYNIALCKDVVTLVTNSSSSLYQFAKAFSYKSVFVKNLSQLCSLLSRLLLNSLLVNILLSSSILHIKRESIEIDPASWPRSSQDRIIESLLDSKIKLQKKTPYMSQISF